MTRPADITPEAMRTLILDTLEANPERVNPTDGPVCLYDDGNGNRCVIGEVLHVLDLKVPDRAYQAGAECLPDDYPELDFTDATLGYMIEAQGEADNHSTRWPVQAGAWGRAAETLRREWEI